MSKNSDKPYSLSPRLAEIIRSFQKEMKNLLPPLYDYDDWSGRNPKSDSEHSFLSDQETVPNLKSDQKSDSPKDRDDFKKLSPDVLAESNKFYRSESSFVNDEMNNIDDRFEKNSVSENQTKSKNQTESEKKRTDRESNDLKRDKSTNRVADLNEPEEFHVKKFSKLTSSSGVHDFRIPVSENFVPPGSSVLSAPISSDDYSKGVNKVDLASNGANHKINSLQISDREKISNSENILYKQPKQQDKQSQKESSSLHAGEPAEIPSENSRGRSGTSSKISQTSPFPERNLRINLAEVISGKEDLLLERKQLENCLKGIAEIKQKLDRLEHKQDRDREEKKEIKILID